MRPLLAPNPLREPVSRSPGVEKVPRDATGHDCEAAVDLNIALLRESL